MEKSAWKECSLIRLCEEDSRALALDLCAPARGLSPRLREAAACSNAAKSQE